MISLLLVIANFHALQAPDCAQASAQWTKQQAASSQGNPSKSHKAAIAFARRYPDDPEGCIRPAVLNEIAKLEAGLIRLVVDGRESVAAQRVLLCNSVDPITQHCSGPDLDDAALSRKGEALLRLGSSDNLKLKIDGSIGLELTGLFVSPPDASKPQPLGKRKNFRMQQPDGQLIAILRSKSAGGEFAFRKVLWRFVPR